MEKGREETEATEKYLSKAPVCYLMGALHLRVVPTQGHLKKDLHAHSLAEGFTTGRKIASIPFQPTRNIQEQSPSGLTDANALRSKVYQYLRDLRQEQVVLSATSKSSL